MKKLIINALDNAYISLIHTVPSTKKDNKTLSVMDVNPIDMADFMKDNNIPTDAWFEGGDNGHDGYDDFLISWDIIVPTNDNDKNAYIKRIFNSHKAHKHVFDSLTTNGYKKVGFNSARGIPFDTTTVYDMYMSKDFERLLEYYSLSFSLS